MGNFNNLSEEDIMNMNDDELEELGQQLGVDSDKDSPSMTKKDSNFRFYRELLKLKDSSKIGFLDEFELGKLQLHVRGYQKLALMAEYLSDEPMEKVAEFMNKQGEIVLATSLSREAKLITLFFTNIMKKETKTTGSSGRSTKRSFLGLGKAKREGGEVI